MGAAALPLVLNYVESKWACAIPARVLARKDPSTRFGAKSPLITLSSRSLVAQSVGAAAEPIKGRSGGGGRPHPKVGTWRLYAAFHRSAATPGQLVRLVLTLASLCCRCSKSTMAISLFLNDYDPWDHDDPDYLDALYDLDCWNGR